MSFTPAERDMAREEIDKLILQGSQLEMMYEQSGRQDCAAFVGTLDTILQKALIWLREPAHDQQVVDVLRAIGKMDSDPRLGL